MTPDYWVAIAAASGGVRVTGGPVGVPTPRHYTQLPADEWRPLLRDVRSALTWTTQLGLGPDVTSGVVAAHEALRSARAALWDRVLAPALADWSGEAVLVFREADLLDLGWCAAAFAAGRAIDVIDVHPRVPAEVAARLRAVRQPWPTPRPSDLVILVGRDLGEGSALPHPRDISANRDVFALVVDAKLRIQRAARLARSAGALVLEGFKLDDFVGAIEGRHRRPAFQLVAHIDVDPSSGRDMLVCADKWLDLRELALQLGKVADWSSPLAAVDLGACASAHACADAMLAAGVVAVSSNAGTWHLGHIALLLERIYERGLLDGTRTFAQAWIRATLPDDPTGSSRTDRPG